MGLLSSFNVGVSGLHAAGSSMTVIGDNIANSGTFGFKKSRAEFQDLLSNSLKGIDGGDQIGSGTKLAHVTAQYSQGNIQRSDNITDLAINGNGFFSVNTPSGRGYTRDGAFHFNKEGFLINADGYTINGFQPDANGEISSKTGPIRVGNPTVPAKSTSKVAITMNLDSRSAVKQFNPADPDNSSNFNSSLTIYDNIGTQRVVTMYFNKLADGQWEYHAMVDGKDAAGGKEGTPVQMANGTISFNQNGQLQQVTESSNSFNFADGASPGQKVNFDFGESIAEGGDGTKSTITQYGSQSSLARHTQDGYSAATLTSMSFDDDGILIAAYDNGVMRNLGQVAVAKFENNEGLFKMGKNLFKETKKSGQAAIGKPQVDGRGQILAKSIELSNVDIADEFISMMNAQRNFQANTKTITTTDQMLQEVLNIKR